MSNVHDAEVDARHMAYDAAARVADQLLAKGLPLIKFDAFDLGRQAAFVFAMPTPGEFIERYVCKLPMAGITAEAVEAQYRRFAI
jgi:hypothetical protein